MGAPLVLPGRPLARLAEKRYPTNYGPRLHAFRRIPALLLGNSPLTSLPFEIIGICEFRVVPEMRSRASVKPKFVYIDLVENNAKALIINLDIVR
jgi:hypothetical protein